jgi:hypothetical protein
MTEFLKLLPYSGFAIIAVGMLRCWYVIYCMKREYPMDDEPWYSNRLTTVGLEALRRGSGPFGIVLLGFVWLNVTVFLGWYFGAFEVHLVCKSCAH